MLYGGSQHMVIFFILEISSWVVAWFPLQLIVFWVVLKLKRIPTASSNEISFISWLYNRLITCAEFGLCYSLELLCRLVLKLTEKLGRLPHLWISRSLMRKCQVEHCLKVTPFSHSFFFLKFGNLFYFYCIHHSVHSHTFILKFPFKIT